MRPDLEFEFFLAEKLRMPVAELRERLSGEEFGQWAVFYARKAQRDQLAQLLAQARK